MSLSSEYRIQGSLEREYNVAALPPTEITMYASETLSRWGISPEIQQHIQKFTSSFRYDLCVPKLQRLLQKPAGLHNVAGRTLVSLYDFYNPKDRIDGQCGDLARQWVTQIHQTGLLSRMNESVQQGLAIVPCVFGGNSKTHFCIPLVTTHVWNGLAMMNLSNKEVVEELFVDASFQAIMGG